MKSFKSYLKESLLLEEESLLLEEESACNENDDKGKLHEILLAKHLHPKKELPEHFRSESENPEHAGTPSQVHKKLRDKMGKTEYDKVNKDAEQTAKAVHAHLKKYGGIPDGHKITGVHWTSNRDTEKKAGDHEKLVKKKDVNSNADLILTSTHSKTGAVAHHPISAKYGSHKPNYKNSGLDSLEKQAGHKTGTYTNIQKAHEQHSEKLGYSGSQAQKHKQYKEDKTHLDREMADHKESGSTKPFKPKHPQAKRAHAAEKSGLDARQKMAREHDKGMAKKSDAELRNHIRSQVSPPTYLPHIIAHSKTKENGTTESHVSDASHMADEHLNKFDNLHVKSGSGISSTIYGTHKKTGKVMPVASQTFKASSGPHKGSAGAFKLH